jgi:hypothetical protein
MKIQLLKIVYITGFLLIGSCDRNTLLVDNASKSICLAIESTDSVSPIPPYPGSEAHYDFIANKSFLLDNNYIKLINDGIANLIDSIQLIVIHTSKFSGLYSGKAFGDTYITVFPDEFIYASAFWKVRKKSYYISFDSITELGEVHFTHMSTPSVLKPGNSLILKDTVYDTVWDTYSGNNSVLYAHRHMRTDSIFNYGYLPFE